MLNFWNNLPAQLRTAIVTALILIVGAAAEWITSILESMAGSPPV